MLAKMTFLFTTLSLFLLFSCGSGNTVKEDPNAIKPGVFKAGKSVTFIFKSPQTDTRSVAITGDFNNWNTSGIQLNPVSGVWTVTLTLDYGIYQYNYIINGKDYLPDPYADAFAPDGKGGKNSIVEVKKD